MANHYRTKKIYNPGQSIFLATSCYDGVKIGYAYSLSQTTAELTRRGITFQLGLMDNQCHVDDGRNLLVRDFLEGNCTDLLFLDSDLIWNASDVIKILSHPEPLVAGAYRLKTEAHKYPIGRILETRPDGMLSVSYAPTGFMRIKRELFEKLWSRVSRHGKQRPIAVFFERKFNKKSRDGGDVTFCRRAIAAGEKVWVDPTFVFSHIGEIRYSGSFINYLSKAENRKLHFEECKDPLVGTPYIYDDKQPAESKDVTIPALIKELIKGNESPEIFQQFADLYGNKPWALTWEALMIMYKMAANLPAGSTILECGCGLSTLILAATGHKVISIEESGEWAERTDKLLTENKLEARIIVAPVDNGWHQIDTTIVAPNMLVIDGPRRRKGVDRETPLKLLPAGTPVLMDDVGDCALLEEGVSCGTTERPFVVGRIKEKG